MSARGGPTTGGGAERGHVAMNAALDVSPLRPIHWRIWGLSAMGVFLDGFDLFVVAVALPLLADEFHAGAVAIGLVGSAAVVGAVAGAALGGVLTDRWGRKSIYLLDLAAFIVLSIAAALSWDLVSLAAFRFLLGVAVGADYPICGAYVSEFMPARVRGRMLIGAFSFQALGTASAAATGMLILAADPSAHAWRWMMFAGAVPAAVVLLARTTVPESARWCMEHGQTDEAVAIVGRIVPERRDELRAIVRSETRYIEKKQAKTLGYRALFSRKYRRRTILVCVPWFLMDIATYGVGIFTPILVGALVFGADGGAGLGVVARDFFESEASAFVDLFLAAGFLLNIWLIERVGRIRLQAVGFLGMVVGLGILAAASARGSHDLLVIFVGFGIFNLLMNLGPNATTFVLPAELFPTKIRASGHGLAAASAKAGATLGIVLLPLVQASAGLTTVLALLGAASLMGMLVTLVFQEETRGRSLEDLHPGEPIL